MSRATDLHRARQLAYDVAARVGAAHQEAAARTDPASEDPYEYALRVAKHRTLAAAQAVHDALVAAEAELQPMGRVRRHE